jgi:hypothetical protein
MDRASTNPNKLQPPTRLREIWESLTVQISTVGGQFSTVGHAYVRSSLLIFPILSHAWKTCAHLRSRPASRNRFPDETRVPERVPSCGTRCCGTRSQLSRPTHDKLPDRLGCILASSALITRSIFQYIPSRVLFRKSHHCHIYSSHPSGCPRHRFTPSRLTSPQPIHGHRFDCLRYMHQDDFAASSAFRV